MNLRREADEHAGERRQRPGDDPREAHHPLDLDAAHLRERRTLRHRAHRHAGTAPRQEHVQADHGRQGQAADEDLIREHAHSRQHLRRHLQFARVVARLVSPDQDDQVAHHERGPERREDHREGMSAAASQPPEHERVDGPRGEPGQYGRDERGGDQLPAERERTRRRAGSGERDDDQREVGAPREELGVREVREAHDAERERHADRAERDDGAGQDPVGERLHC
jgi:hypothetical protein